MRIVVTGGRKFSDERYLTEVLTALHQVFGIECLAEGGASGADHLAARCADMYSIPRQRFFAEWDRYGRSAGIRRNVEMLKDFKPDVVVAFPGGKGTDHCVKTAKRLGIWVLEV